MLTSTHRDLTMASLYGIVAPVVAVVTVILVDASMTTSGAWWLPLLILCPQGHGRLPATDRSASER